MPGEATRLARGGLVGNVNYLQDAFSQIETSERASNVYVLERPSFTLAGARFDIDCNAGQGYWEFLRLASDMFVMVSDMTYRESVPVRVLGEDFIEFHFRLAGTLSLDHAPDTRMEVTGPSLLIWRQAAGCDITEYIHGGSRDTTVTLYCRPSVLERYFGNYMDSLSENAQACLGASCSDIVSLRPVLYPSLLRRVMEFAQPPVQGALKLAYFESVAGQILCEVINLLRADQSEVLEACRLSDRDIRCLSQARELIHNQYTPPMTISDLARNVGMSATKLKNGFRTLYGKTIYDFANELRMEYARELLKKADTPIASVSETLGYEFQNSFTVAFKRQFGLLPKDYRRNPLAWEVESKSTH